MTPEAQRIAIAEACGPWRFVKESNKFETESYIVIYDGDRTVMRFYPSRPNEIDMCLNAAGLPDYLNDLNAVHEAEKVLKEEQYSMRESSRPQDHAPLRYYGILLEVVSPDRKSGTNFSPFDYFSMATATAAQRAEAFLRTLGLWKD